jgi:transposase-like protein
MNLDSVYRKYSTQEDCYNYLEKLLWNKIPICPYCNSKKNTIIKNSKRYHCNNCNTSFSVTVNTIFHKTKIDLQKWFLAIHLIMNFEDKKSLRVLAKNINTTKDTSMRILNSVRKELNKQDSIILKIIENV